jgi:hypothetical protein
MDVMGHVLGFPNPVNEKAARAVAAGVLLMSVVALVLSLAVSDTWLWIIAPMALGFWARVLTGPTLSPLGRLATKVIAPRLGTPRLVPGPPKRFAQAGLFGLTQIVLGLMIVAAGLESIFAVCIGCAVFGWLMRRGVIPEQVCAECADISLRYAKAA